MRANPLKLLSKIRHPGFCIYGTFLDFWNRNFMNAVDVILDFFKARLGFRSRKWYKKILRGITMVTRSPREINPLILCSILEELWHPSVLLLNTSLPSIFMTSVQPPPPQAPRSSVMWQYTGRMTFFIFRGYALLPSALKHKERVNRASTIMTTLPEKNMI